MSEASIPEIRQPNDRPLTEAEREFLKRLLKNPLDFPDAFKRWVGDYFGTNVPLIPFGNFLGSKVNIAKSGDFILATEGPGPASFGNISGGTVGPSITGLANGVYLVFWGANTTGGAHEGFMGVSVNGDTPTDGNSAGSAYDQQIAHGRIIDVQQNHNNSIVAKYKGGQQSWGRRWISVIRVATGA